MEHICEFKVGTPTPISFRETFGTSGDIEIELSARMAMTIGVIEYDEEKYGECEQLTQTLKEQMQDILTNVLNTKMKGSPLRNGIPPRYLKPALEAELSTIGVTAEAEIISFVLTEESEKLFKEKSEESKNIFRMKMAAWGDPTDRPLQPSAPEATDTMGMIPDNYKSDCAPPPLFDLTKSNMPLDVFLYKTDEEEKKQKEQLEKMKPDKFCRNCGAKRSGTAKFCTECGTFFN